MENTVELVLSRKVDNQYFNFLDNSSSEKQREHRKGTENWRRGGPLGCFKYSDGDKTLVSRKSNRIAYCDFKAIII